MVTCPHCGLEHSDQLLRCPKCDTKTATARRMDQVYGEIDRQRRLVKNLRRLAIFAIIALFVWYVWSTASDMAAARLGSAPAGPAAPEP